MSSDARSPMWHRFMLYAVVGCVVSTLQFGGFDCNELPGWSLAGGALTVFTTLFMSDRIYAVSVSQRSVRARVIRVAALGLVLGSLAVGLGWITMITHM